MACSPLLSSLHRLVGAFEDGPRGDWESLPALVPESLQGSESMVVMVLGQVLGVAAWGDPELPLAVEFIHRAPVRGEEPGTLCGLEPNSLDGL